MRDATTAIIECGAERVAFGRFCRELAAPALVESAEVPLAGAGRTGPSWPARLTQALVALRGKVGYTGGVTVLVPGHLLVAKHVRTPALAKAAGERVLSFEAAQALPLPLDQVNWTHVPAEAGETAAVHVVFAVRAEHLAELMAAVTSAGFDPVGALPEPLAVRAAARCAPAGDGEAVLVVHVAGLAATLILETMAGFRVRVAPFAVGGPVPAGSERGSVVAVEGQALRLACEVERTLAHFERLGCAVRPGQVLLCGGAAGAVGLPEALAARLQLPVERLGGQDAGGKHFVELSGAAAIGFGLAGQGADLLPTRLRRHLALRRNRRPLAVAAVLSLAALVPPAWHWGEAGREARQRMAQVHATLVPLREAAAVGARQRELRDLHRRQLAWLEEAQRRRERWPGLLAGLEERFVADGAAWIERIEPRRSGSALEAVVVSGWLGASPERDDGRDHAARVRGLLAGSDVGGRSEPGAVAPLQLSRRADGALGFQFVLPLAAVGRD